MKFALSRSFRYSSRVRTLAVHSRGLVPRTEPFERLRRSGRRVRLNWSWRSRVRRSLCGPPLSSASRSLTSTRLRGGAEGSSAAAPLGTLRIAGAKLLDEGRTLLLATDPHPRVARYELVLGPTRKAGQTFVYDLSGVEATWSAMTDEAGAEPAWKGWWPDLDVDATRRLTHGSAPHERALAMIEQPGRLTLSTLLSLPPGETTLRLEANGPISEATLGDAQPVD